MKHEKCWIYTYKLGKLLPEIYSKEIGKHICMYVHILFFVNCIITILYLLLITLLFIWEYLGKFSFIIANCDSLVK